MPVNPVRVDISLQKFQNIASGTYNAGEVKLDGANSLAKMNHHVTLRGSNDKTISHAEVLLIKDAFLRALASNGVGAGEIDRIRKDLGLAPNGSPDRSLRSRSVKPLSRQQIREILDRNANAINAHNAGDPHAARIRTSAELYGAGGMDAGAAAVRDEVNAANARLGLRENVTVALCQSLVSGDVDFRSNEGRRDILRLARKNLDQLLLACHGQPRADKPASLTYTMPSGHQLVFETGKSEAEFARHLEDVIVRLDRQAAPRDVDREARREIASLRTPEARTAWLNALVGDGEAGGFKARTFTVKFLHDAGIVDARLLSVPNRLSDADAIVLALHLASLPEGTGADALRANNLLAAMAQKPRARVDAFHTAFVPAVTDRQFNQWVSGRIASGAEGQLPRFQSMMENIRFEIRDLYGRAGCPDTLPANCLVPTNIVSDIFREQDPDAPRATPESVRDALFEAARRSAVDRLVEARVEAALAGIEGGDDASAITIRLAVQARHPEIFERLLAAGTPAEAEQILSDAAGTIEERARAAVKIKGYQDRVADWAREGLADRLGISPDALGGNALKLSRLQGAASELARAIGKGEKPIEGDEAVEAAFRDLARKFVDERIACCDKIDASPLPPAAKGELKVLVLRADKIKHVDIEALLREAAAVDVTDLEALLRANAPKEQVYAAMGQYTRTIDTAIRGRLLAGRDIGPEETMLPEDLVTTAVVMARPGLDKLLIDFFDRPDVRGDAFFSMDADTNLEGPTAAKRLLRYSSFGELAVDRDIAASLREPGLVRAFLDGPGAQRALAAGYHARELPALARAYALYKDATGCSDAEAVAAALDPQSKARRLLDYGGRFAAGSANFRRGLALLDRFAAWFDKLQADHAAGKRDTMTLLNLNKTICGADSARAVERFLFEEIAVDDALSLDPADPEEVFGMEHNPAMRFVGRGFTTAFANTLAQVPPEERGLLYRVFDVVEPAARDAGESAGKSQLTYTAILGSRVLKNFDAVAALQRAGTLDRAHLYPLLFPDLHLAENAGAKQFDDAVSAACMQHPQHMVTLFMLLGSSGATVGDCLAAIQSQARLPPAPHVSSHSGHLYDLDGTAKAGRNTMIGDLLRPTNPKSLQTGAPLLREGNDRFTCRFPDGETLVARPGNLENPEVKTSCNAIADKIETLCGKMHPKQVSSVCFALSQSAIGANAKDAFRLQGVDSDEHMAVSFALAKDEATGAVTVTYTQPEGFPVRFHWTSTIALDGTTTTTPMIIEA